MVAGGLQPTAASRKRMGEGTFACETLQSLDTGFGLSGMCPVSLASQNPRLIWRSADSQVVSWQVRSASSLPSLPSLPHI